MTVPPTATLRSPGRPAPAGHGCASAAGHGGAARSAGPAEHVPTPIDVLLRRQHELTPVERFATRVDHGDEVAGARWWQDRLPAEAPGPGQQYGFRVDLDACTGCKACVAACHNLNGLEPDEQWRRVGSLHGSTGARPVVQTVTTACHHCVEPACLSGCPADAYEKDPVTGIVRHLDDACIGCSYCTLTCPYEVPTFRPDLGIVRKCDMCADRLADGEAPACVQGCPTAAITIDVVEVADLVTASRVPGAALVAGAPPSAVTVPSSTYTGGPGPDDLEAADEASVPLGHAHDPLAVMLVLTQVSVGGFAIAAVTRLLGGSVPGPAAPVALVTGLVALAASVLHLGRPLLAWRAVLGVRHSWLSREILAFTAFAAAATASAGASIGALPGEAVATATAAGLGVVAVGCSVHLYAVTGREWWAWRTSGPRFAATAGAGGALLVATVVAAGPDGGRGSTVALVATAAACGVLGALVPITAVAPVRSGRSATARRTWLLLTGPLAGVVIARLGLLVLGVAVLPLLALSTLDDGGGGGVAPGVLLGLATLATVAAELVERRLFFLASVAPRMPGLAR